MLVLTDLDKIDASQGYFVGTTNQLFLNLPKLKPDLVVDLDQDSYKITTPDDLKQLLKPSSYDQKIFKRVSTMPKLNLNEAADSVYQLNKADQVDVTHLMQRDEREENKLKQVVTDYLQGLHILVSYLYEVVNKNRPQE